MSRVVASPMAVEVSPTVLQPPSSVGQKQSAVSSTFAHRSNGVLCFWAIHSVGSGATPPAIIRWYGALVSDAGVCTVGSARARSQRAGGRHALPPETHCVGELHAGGVTESRLRSIFSRREELLANDKPITVAVRKQLRRKRTRMSPASCARPVVSSFLHIGDAHEPGPSFPRSAEHGSHQSGTSVPITGSAREGRRSSC